MDIKTRLEDEKLFSKWRASRIEKFNYMGVYTVEDFLNLTAKELGSNTYGKQYRVYQEILRHKYLNEPLVMDVILDNEYLVNGEIDTVKLFRDTVRLGFGNYHFIGTAKQALAKNGSCKMIDIIRLLDEKFDNLAPFYIEYYDTQKRKEQESYSTGENDKTTLDELKNQLVSLLNRRNELDLQISSLLEQINTLEGGKVANGRK